MEENSYQSASGMEASGNGEGPLFAVNYSNAAAELFRRKRIDVDLWKCPAWPDVVSLARESRAVYVHFPLLVGSGGGDAIDTETQQPADWDKVESLLAQTGTPWVNLHLGTRTRDYPELPADTTAPDHVKMLAERMTRDVQAVVDRFGAERVIVENVYDGRGMFLRPCLLGENIRMRLFAGSLPCAAGRTLPWDRRSCVHCYIAGPAHPRNARDRHTAARRPAARSGETGGQPF
jgi:hypothetical protein